MYVCDISGKAFAIYKAYLIKRNTLAKASQRLVIYARKALSVFQNTIATIWQILVNLG